MTVVTATNQIQELLGNQLESLESASLRHDKMICYNPKEKVHELEAFCNLANSQGKKIEPPVFQYDTNFQMKLGGRLLVNLAGGILENSGCSLHPFFNYPFIPGSALKGVAGYTAWLEWDLAQVPDQRRDLAQRIFRVFGFPTNNPHLDRFGEDTIKQEDQAGKIAFLPAVPADRNWKMVVDVLTPHHGCDYKNPTPNFFPAVERGATFTFFLRKLRGATDEDLQQAERWLKAALKEQGIGAKTAAGYGWFMEN